MDSRTPTEAELKNHEIWGRPKASNPDLKFMISTPGSLYNQ